MSTVRRPVLLTGDRGDSSPGRAARRRDRTAPVTLAGSAWCPTCAARCAVEHPGCDDAHDESPEGICLTCDSALLVDPVLVPAGADPSRPGRAA